MHAKAQAMCHNTIARCFREMRLDPERRHVTPSDRRVSLTRRMSEMAYMAASQRPMALDRTVRYRRLRVQSGDETNRKSEFKMKQLMILSGAFMLLGGTYAIWLEQRRHRRMEEQARDLQVWESEGGGVVEGTEEARNKLLAQPSESAYS